MLCSPKLLDCADKVDWRGCVLPQAEESKSAQELKAAFRAFDFNADDDSDED